MDYKLKSTGILGIGNSIPQKVITNHDLEKMVDTSDEWIIKRTGISERRVLEKDKPVYGLGIEASKRALESSGLKAEDIDLIIVSTSTPDYLTPSMSCIIQRHIGAFHAAAFDVNSACTGFIYGLTVAEQFIKSGYARYILLVACEGLSKVTDWEDRNTCVLFGDGAGAVVLGPTEDSFGLLSTYIGSDGRLGHNITIPCCHIDSDDLEKRHHENKRVLWMDGSEVMKFAIRVMAKATYEVLERAGLRIDDLKYIIPHQANIRIIDGAAKRLGISTDRVYTNLHRYGNISSASIPVALEEIVNDKLLVRGDNIVLVGFGGGLTWGSALIRWG